MSAIRCPPDGPPNPSIEAAATHPSELSKVVVMSYKLHKGLAACNCLCKTRAILWAKVIACACERVSVELGE